MRRTLEALLSSEGGTDTIPASPAETSARQWAATNLFDSRGAATDVRELWEAHRERSGGRVGMLRFVRLLIGLGFRVRVVADVRVRP